MKRYQQFVSVKCCHLLGIAIIINGKTKSFHNIFIKCSCDYFDRSTGTNKSVRISFPVLSKRLCRTQSIHNTESAHGLDCYTPINICRIIHD